MKNKTVKFEIPYTTKQLEIDESLVVPLIFTVPMLAVCLSLAIFGINVTLVLCLIAFGTLAIQSIRVIDKDES